MSRSRCPLAAASALASAAAVFPLRCLARAHKGLARPVDHLDPDRAREVIEAEDQIDAPVVQPPAPLVIPDLFQPGPARRPDDASLQLVRMPSELTASPLSTAVARWTIRWSVSQIASGRKCLSTVRLGSWLDLPR